MRSLIVVSGRMFGGGQRVACDIVRALSANNRIHADLCLLGGPVEQLGDIVAAVVEYDGRYDRVRSMRITEKALRKRLWEDHPDIVHSHGWDASLITALALRGSRQAHILHVHTCDDWLGSARVRHRVRRVLTKWMFQRPRTTVVAVCNAVRLHWADALGASCAPTRVLHNCVDTNLYSPRAMGRISAMAETVGVAARLAGGKGLEDLLDAVDRLARKGTRFRLIIAGDGPLRAHLVELARGKFSENRVEFRGFVRNMPAFYQELDLAVLPSTNEGLPLTVMEAMSCGIPVVASRVGGTAEVLRDRIDGIIVSPKAPGEIATAIEEVLGKPETRLRMGRSARSRIVQHFSLRAFGEQLCGLYEDVVIGRGPFLSVG